MGIFQKLSTLMRSNINDAIARAENPEKMLNQVLIDMREQLAKAKQEVAVAIADERKLRSQVETEQKSAHDWEHRAMLAVGEGRDDLAKQALLRQHEHMERALSLEETWRRHSEETERLKDSLRALNDKIEEAKRKKNLLVAKQKRAQAQKRIHETMAGLNDQSAFETFERMADKIEESERRALAAAEVSESLSGDTLEQQFQQLKPANESVEFRLLELKQKMGLSLPAGESDSASRRLGAGDRDDPIVRDAEIEEEA
ncbi:MAG: PspA/IM30 family protein [Gemmatimonadetes bacterium]|nr:PspA/IM30 family protein [Gemmatimonadota bacterium]